MANSVAGIRHRRPTITGAARGPRFVLCVGIIATTALILAGSIENAHADVVTRSRAEGIVAKNVLNRGVIRCGYINYAPDVVRDPNSNKLSGIMVDAMEDIGRKLGLNIDWTEEVGFGSVFEGLDAGRYDTLCSGLWQNATRGKRAYFTGPLFFNAVRVWMRANETRFNKLADLNASGVRIAVQDGAIEDVIAQRDFPKAQRYSIPQLSPWSDNLLNITTNKADVTLAEQAVITPFLEKNPGTLKELRTAHPPRVFANALPIKMGEGEFKAILDSAILEMLLDGTMDAILSKYEKAPGELLRVAPPYQEPQH